MSPHINQLMTYSRKNPKTCLLLIVDLDDLIILQMNNQVQESIMKVFNHCGTKERLILYLLKYEDPYFLSLLYIICFITLNQFLTSIS